MKPRREGMRLKGTHWKETRLEGPHRKGMRPEGRAGKMQSERNAVG